MRAFIKVMKALSDPSRVKIIKMLQHRTMCVCEMQAALRLSQSAVSNHLKILEEAGMVIFFKEGLWVNYSLANGESSPYAAAMLRNLQHWLDEAPDVAGLIKELPTFRREDICRR